MYLAIIILSSGWRPSLTLQGSFYIKPNLSIFYLRNGLPIKCWWRHLSYLCTIQGDYGQLPQITKLMQQGHRSSLFDKKKWPRKKAIFFSSWPRPQLPFAYSVLDVSRISDTALWRREISLLYPRKSARQGLKRGPWLPRIIFWLAKQQSPRQKKNWHKLSTEKWILL